MSEPPTEKPRGWYALHLLWTVPLAIGISFVPIAMSGFAICGLACFGPGDMHYDRVPVAVGLCALAGCSCLRRSSSCRGPNTHRPACWCRSRPACCGPASGSSPRSKLPSGGSGPGLADGSSQGRPAGVGHGTQRVTRPVLSFVTNDRLWRPEQKPELAAAPPRFRPEWCATQRCALRQREPLLSAAEARVGTG